MAARASRLMSALTAGGVLAGSLLLGSATADASPQPPGGGTVPARCGQTVTAYPGDRVKVTPALGLPFVQNVTAGMGPVAMTISGVLCSVNVKVLVPVSQQLTAVAPPLGQVTTKVTEGVGEVLAPSSQSAPSAALVPAPRAAAPMAPIAPSRAPVSTLPGGGSLSTLPTGQPAADAPLYAPAFSNELPSSFLSTGSPAAVAAPAAGAGSLFGSAFPGLNTGAPALGYAPTSAVTTASQVQALPVDGFSDGVGIPAILAVLALSGAAAFAVRRMVLGKSLVPAALTVGPAAGGAAAPLAAPAPAEAPAEADVERTALVGAPVADAEATSVTPAVPALDPAEETAVAPALADAEVTSVTPAVPALDPAEVTAVTPAVTDGVDAVDEAPAVPEEVPAEVTGVIDGPVDAPADPESTGVLAAATK